MLASQHVKPELVPTLQLSAARPLRAATDPAGQDAATVMPLALLHAVEDEAHSASTVPSEYGAQDCGCKCPESQFHEQFHEQMVMQMAREGMQEGRRAGGNTRTTTLGGRPMLPGQTGFHLPPVVYRSPHRSI